MISALISDHKIKIISAHAIFAEIFNECQANTQIIMRVGHPKIIRNDIDHTKILDAFYFVGC